MTQATCKLCMVEATSQQVAVWRRRTDEINLRQSCSLAYCIQHYNLVFHEKTAHRSGLSLYHKELSGCIVTSFINTDD